MAATILETERLILRSTRKGDAAEIHRVVFSNADVMRYVFTERPFSLAETQKLFAEKFDHEGDGRRLGIVEELSTGSLVGFAGMLGCTALGTEDYEIGFVFGKNFWGKGYATEIGMAQLNYGFDVVGCERLLAQVATENAASKAALKKIRMCPHSIVRSTGRRTREIYIALREV